MLTDAIVLTVVGIAAVLLPLSAGYRSRLTRRLAEDAGADVPPTQVPALEARMTRRARAVGGGILAAGVLLLLLAALWPAGTAQPSGGYVLMSLMFVFGAAGLALVEIVRPGDVTAGPRWARATAPTMADYVPPPARAMSWAFTAAGLVILLLTVALAQTRWFDAETVWRSAVPFLVVAIPAMAALFAVAARRVLAAPQPARDEVELYWQDAVRANTLQSLTVPPAVVSLLGIIVSGAVLDDAASATAVASGQVAPDWTLWLLVGGYVLPFALVIGALLVATHGGEKVYFRRRLWGGRPAVQA